jgi:hypothetical protein
MPGWAAAQSSTESAICLEKTAVEHLSLHRIIVIAGRSNTDRKPRETASLSILVPSAEAIEVTVGCT